MVVRLLGLGFGVAVLAWLLRSRPSAKSTAKNQPIQALDVWGILVDGILPTVSLNSGIISTEDYVDPDNCPTLHVIGHCRDKHAPQVLFSMWMETNHGVARVLVRFPQDASKTECVDSYKQLARIQTDVRDTLRGWIWAYKSTPERNVRNT